MFMGCINHPQSCIVVYGIGSWRKTPQLATLLFLGKKNLLQHHFHHFHHSTSNIFKALIDTNRQSSYSNEIHRTPKFSDVPAHSTPPRLEPHRPNSSPDAAAARRRFRRRPRPRRRRPRGAGCGTDAARHRRGGRTLSPPGEEGAKD